MNEELILRLEKIEHKYLKLKRMFIGLVVLLSLFVVGFAFKANESFNLIRAKGIIIEDEKGRDRILIGSPIPFSKDRVRTNDELVRKHWASKFKNPDEYMGWYKNYSHTADGIVFMNDEGYDEVLVGANLADANVGVRQFKMSGLLVNNKQGWERVGAGVNTLKNGKTRQGFGVDDDSGEALHMMTMEDGSKGIIIGGENGSLRIGMAKKEGELFQNKNEFTGIKYFDTSGKLVWEQKMTKNKK